MSLPRKNKSLHACVFAAVTLQDKRLKPKKSEQHHAWHFEDGAYIETSWDQFKPGLGNTVVVLTGDIMRICRPVDMYSTVKRP